MKNIVFVLSSSSDPHYIKRVESFIENGYNVKVYAFQRNHKSTTNVASFPIEIVGNAYNNKYIGRICVMLKAIKNIAKKHGLSDIFFYGGLDIAMFARLFVKNKYIYEECDLTQTYVSSKFIQKVLEIIDKRVIKKSLETILTSEGFLDYHSIEKLDNISLLPNKLSPIHRNLAISNKVKSSKFRIAFVGSIRYNTIFNFAYSVGEFFPNITFTFYGINSGFSDKQIKALEKFQNISFMGPFKSLDLAKIYSNVDLLVSTYDVTEENVRYAEPNKLYEAIYYETPIVVSKGTFLERKVNDLGIGYSVDANSISKIREFISNISMDDLMNKTNNCQKITKDYAIEDNTLFFNKIAKKI